MRALSYFLSPFASCFSVLVTPPVFRFSPIVMAHFHGLLMALGESSPPPFTLGADRSSSGKRGTGGGLPSFGIKPSSGSVRVGLFCVSRQSLLEDLCCGQKGVNGLMCILADCRVQTHQVTKLYQGFADGDASEELVFIMSATGKDVHVDPWIPASRFGNQRETVLADTREVVIWQGLFQSLMSGEDAFEEGELLEVQERLKLGDWLGTITRAGCVVKIDESGVYVMVTKERWEKTQRHVLRLRELVEAGTLLPHRELESMRGFLVCISRTYPAMTTFLKGLNLTIDVCRPDRDEEGWQLNNNAGLPEERADFYPADAPPY
jgi:hypothetical protein